MPNTSSAKKALRQNTRRRAINRVRKDTLKETIKTFKKLVKNNSTKEAHAALAKVFEIADKTAKTKIIKKTKASRIKSRTAKMLQKIEK